jgi:tetratricopeptide (TPR) repeat protein
MTARPGWFWLCVLSAGCQSLAPLEAAEGPQVTARQLWVKGQEAMQQGQPAQTVQYLEQSREGDEGLARNHLSLAAAYLEQGDQSRAAPHLARYVNAYPQHHVVRAHYAELLMRLHRHKEAREQYERFVADVQDLPELASRHLIHCHSRLMEIAEGAGDEYNEHLNRGIGLFLLACERAAIPEAESSVLCTESVLCKAAGELSQARLQRRDEARPCWYLYEVWSRLAQRQPAVRHLREADRAAPFSYLTPTEKRNLQLARLSCEVETRGRR